MKIGNRNYFRCLYCRKIFHCDNYCGMEANYCFCHPCAKNDCDTRKSNSKVIELIFKLKGI